MRESLFEECVRLQCIKADGQGIRSRRAQGIRRGQRQSAWRNQASAESKHYKLLSLCRLQHWLKHVSHLARIDPSGAEEAIHKGFTEIVPSGAEEAIHKRFTESSKMDRLLRDFERTKRQSNGDREFIIVL